MIVISVFLKGSLCLSLPACQVPAVLPEADRGRQRAGRTPRGAQRPVRQRRHHHHHPHHHRHGRPRQRPRSCDVDALTYPAPSPSHPPSVVPVGTSCLAPAATRSATRTCCPRARTCTPWTRRASPPRPPSSAAPRSSRSSSRGSG
jgi:hypothetical protein